MTLKLVICPHCGYKYKTNIKEIADDGITHVTRQAFSGLNKSKKKTSKSSFIDLTCPKCKKQFEYEVKS